MQVADTIESAASSLQPLYEVQCSLKQYTDRERLRGFSDIKSTVDGLKKILGARRTM